MIFYDKPLDEIRVDCLPAPEIPFAYPGPEIAHPEEDLTRPAIVVGFFGSYGGLVVLGHVFERFDAEHLAGPYEPYSG